MSTFFLLFGNTPELSRLEFTSLHPEWPLFFCEKNLFGFSGPELDEKAAKIFANELLQELGGTIKILWQRESFDLKVKSQTVLESLVEILSQQEKKIHFTFQQLGKQQLEISQEAIKEELTKKDRPARYFSAEPQEVAFLAHHQNAREIFVFQDTEHQTSVLCETFAVQDLDNWTKKDRQKPYANRRKGMLPPKVALMMTNIAFGSYRQANPGKKDVHLYDPFCGTGTVLIEAALRGLKVFGSDLDQESVNGTRENLNWLAAEYGLTLENRVFLADASRLQKEQLPVPVELLVTEPFLGRQTPNPAELTNVFRGLEKMYLGAFNSFQKVLVDGARVCFIFPAAEMAGKQYTMQGLIDKLQAKGYNLLVKPLRYARQGAVIQREICLFEFSAKK